MLLVTNNLMLAPCPLEFFPEIIHNAPDIYMGRMSLKLFSAIHDCKGESAAVFFHEKKTDIGTVWLFGNLPYTGESAHQIETELKVLFEKELLGVFSEEETHEDRFEAALKKANTYLAANIGEKAEDVLRSGALIIGYLTESELLVSNYGQGEVFLMRDRSLIEISEGLSPIKVGGEFFANISSGDLQNHDKLVFSTIRLQRYITERQLAGYLEDGVTEAMESISSTMGSAEPGTVFLVNVKTADTLPLPNMEGAPEGKAQDTEFSLESLAPQVAAFFKRFTGGRRASAHNKPWIIAGVGAVGVLLIFLFVSLLSGETSNPDSLKYEEFINNVEKEFSMVETRLQEGNAEQANLMLSRIEERAQEMLLDRVEVSNAETILQLVGEKREVVNRIMRITNPDITSDLQIAKDGVVTKGLFFLGSELFVYDATNLFRILLSGSDPENLGLLTNGEVALGTAFPSMNELVFVTESGSVVEWSDNQTSSAVTADSTWKPTIDIAPFSKFIYFLDPTGNQIWKYERRDSGFTVAEGWITDQTDISAAISFAIDGSIFVLTSNGEIFKYYRGSRVNYDVKGTPGGPLAGDIIFTDEDNDELYVLDKTSRSIYVFGKGENEAVYKKQIVIENTEALIDIYVREGRLFVLGEQKVYEIKL